MNFDVRPTDGIRSTDPAITPQPTVAKTAEPRFARIFQLEEARERAAVPLGPLIGDRIPPEIWDEVEKAASLVETLQAEGKSMVFDMDKLTGKVVANLLGPDGEQTAVGLTDVVDPGRTAAVADGTRPAAVPAPAQATVTPLPVPTFPVAAPKAS